VGFNIFSLSDEEMLALTPEQYAEMAANASDTSGSDDSGSDVGAGDEELGEAQGTSEAQGTEGDASAGAGDEEQASQGEEGTVTAEAGDASATTTSTEPAGKEKVEGAVSETPQTSESKPAESGSVDYKSEYEKLTAPFTANGREISVKSVDDAIALMQMGANYNKKMAALKPNLKLMRLLENNNLLSEEKINFLIDLDKKTPGAVNKLIKESGLDPLDLENDKAGEYTPTARTVDDREIELDEVLGEISSSPAYQRTIGIVSSEWDASSKRTIAETPQLLKVIDAHVRNGVYDLIKAEVESERMFGRLQGISDIEAYRQVGDSINARGGFDHLNPQRQQTPPPVVVSPKPKASEENLNDKRRAAAAAKPAAISPKPAKEFNPLALSDEEFMKLSSKKY